MSETNLNSNSDEEFRDSLATSPGKDGCKGINCGAKDGASHSPECICETAMVQGWADSDEAREAARKVFNISAAQAVRVPEGWRLVREGPMTQMVDAAERIDWANEDVRASCIKLWYAMLAASPLPPAQPEPSDELGDEYEKALEKLASSQGMSRRNVLRAAIRLYQAERNGLVVITHRDHVPLVRPEEAQPPAQPVGREALSDFEGNVVIGHSVERGGWCVYEEVAPGEYEAFKGPFGTMAEAEKAMRAHGITGEGI